ncbi:MAG: YpmA family protein [Bacillota bacterium]
MTKPEGSQKLQVIAARSFEAWEELYKIIDFLNKTLKHKNVILGLTKEKATGKMTITIYET